MNFQKVAIPKLLREARLAPASTQGAAERATHFFSTASHSRTLTVLSLLLLVAVVPLTVYVGQQNQDLRQQAANSPSDSSSCESICADSCQNSINPNCDSNCMYNCLSSIPPHAPEESTPLTCEGCLRQNNDDASACEVQCNPSSNPPAEPNNPECDTNDQCSQGKVCRSNKCVDSGGPRGGPDSRGTCEPATDKEPYPQECTTSDEKTGAYLVTVYKWTATKDVCKYETTECKTQSSNPIKSNCTYGTTCPDGKPTECKGIENNEGVCKYDDGIGPQCTPACSSSDGEDNGGGEDNGLPCFFKNADGTCNCEGIARFGNPACYGGGSDESNDNTAGKNCPGGTSAGCYCLETNECEIGQDGKARFRSDDEQIQYCKNPPPSEEPGIIDETCNPFIVTRKRANSDSNDDTPIFIDPKTGEIKTISRSEACKYNIQFCGAGIPGNEQNGGFCMETLLGNIPPGCTPNAAPRTGNNNGGSSCTELLGIKFCACDFFPNNPECKNGSGSSTGGGSKPGTGGSNTGGGRPGSSGGSSGGTQGGGTSGQPAVWKCDPSKYGIDGQTACNGFDVCKDKIGKGNPDCDKNYGTGGKYQQITKDHTDFQKKSSGSSQTANSATCAVTTSSTPQDPNKVTYVGLGGTVRLWARAKTPVQDPANTIWPFKGVQTYGNSPAYELDECSGSQYPPCGNTFNVSVPTGDYTFFCDVTNTPNECSGDSSSGKKACSSQNSKALSVSQTSLAGVFQEATCQSLKGWVRNPQDTASNVKVEFFVNKGATNNKDLTQDQSLGQVSANTPRSDLTFTDKNHGFVFTIPDAVKKSLFSKKRDITAIAVQEKMGKTITTTLGTQTITCSTAAASEKTPNAAEGVPQDQVEFYLQQIGGH